MVIPKLNNIKVKMKKSGLLISAAIVFGISFTLAGILYAGNASIEAILYICVTLAAIITMMLAIQRSNDMNEAQMDEFNELLSHYPSSDLKKLQVSPELDEKEKKLVTEFLNKHHPGWSLEN